MKKMILKSDEKTCLALIAEYEAKIQAGTDNYMTKMFLKEAQQKLSLIQKELAELK